MPNPLKNFDAVFRDATDPILIEDLDGRVLDLNDEAIKSYGFAADEIVGRPIKLIVPPERHQQADQLLRRCRAGEEVRNVEGLRVTKNGRRIPVLLSLSLLSNDVGEPTAIATFAKDISSLREFEEENRQLTRVFRDAADPIILEDLDGIVVNLNRAAETLYGWNREQLVGRPITTIVPESHHWQATQLLSRCKAGEEVRDIEGLRLTKDETVIPVLMSLSLLRDDEGQPTGVVSFAKDISLLRQSEAEKQRLSRVFMDAADPIVIEDLSGNVIDINLEAVQVYGWQREEIIGQPIKRIVPEERFGQADELLQRCLSGEEVRNVEGLRVSRDGAVYEVLLTLSLLRDENGEPMGIASIAKDITELRQSEAATERLSREIRARRESEEQLREGEERFNLTVRGSGDGLWDHDPATGEMWFSDRFRELLGYSNEADYPNVADSWSDGLHPSDREATLHAFASHLEKDVPYDVEYRLKTKTGEYRWFRARGISLRDDTGRSYRAAGSITDITEQKQAEEELRQSEERFDLTVRGSGDGLWDHNPATGELWYADRFRELLGYSSVEEYPNVVESWSNGLHPDDRQATLDAFAAHLERDVPYDVEYRLKTKTGEYRWFRARGISLRDDTGRSCRASGSITDITNQKLAEHALAASEERSRLLLESAPDGMMIADDQARIAMVNAQFEVLFGFTKQEIIGQTIEVLLPERFRAKHVGQRDAFFAKPSVREMGSGKELYARRKDGSEFPVEISLSPLQTDEGLLVSSSIRDITERKQAEAELVEARTAAEAANQAKSDFLANMSHEIRTPMNGIMGMTELALGTDLSKEQREFLTTIESSADSLLSLINDILDFSKIEAKKLELDPVNFELRERIGDTLTTLAARAHSKGLELVFDVDSEVPESLVGDVHRIRQILVNLLGNAIKFTEQGEIVLRIELTSLVEDRVTLRFVVKDTGIGLPPEKMETIFQPFEQADLSTTRKYGGTGLGLAICVRLVELMGGEIEVDSKPGQGTTFSFTADLRIGEHTPSKHVTMPPQELRGLRVLVIDDNETNRRILARMLENWGMESVVVDSAAKGLHALQASLADQPIGLVLSDVNMPEMDGFMFAKQVKDHQTLQKTPIILLTSANRSGDSARCRQLGIAAHLIKPARQSFLFDAIATSVGIGDADENASGDGDGDQQRDLAQQGLRLLLAEDNATNQKFAVRSLTKAGHTVIVANNGQEAVELWAAGSFDAVLMDIQMPVMDGYDATAEIRRRESSSQRHTPIIAMTAHAMKGDKEKCLEAGMDGYVTKPIKTKLMLAELARVLEKFPPPGDSGLRQEPIDDRRV